VTTAHKTLAAIAALSLGGALLAADAATVNSPRPNGGTSKDPSASAVPKSRVIRKAEPNNVYLSAQYSSAGAALRNRATAGLNLSGVVGPVQDAALYWAVILPTEVDPPAVQAMRLRRDFPLPVANAVVRGKLIGRGASPCWGGDHISVYKGIVPPAFGVNGAYDVSILSTGVGATTGDDPWATPVVFPLWEGATLLSIGTGAGTVNVFDAGSVAGNTFSRALSYSLTLAGPVTGGPRLFETFGADGQVGASRSASVADSGETTTINLVPISGTGAPDGDSDWNGNSGAPLPQLWDDTGHKIVAKFSPTLNVSITASGDCLTGVGNVVQF
jgi:hypothetical protein